MIKTSIMIVKSISVAIAVWFAVTGITAASQIAQSDHFIRMRPVQVTHNFAMRNGPQIIKPYIKVTSKKAGKALCGWMPRIQDAFILALSQNHRHQISASIPSAKKIDYVLKNVLRRIVPAHLAVDVITFDVHNPKDFHAERKLKKKLNCKKNNG